MNSSSDLFHNDHVRKRMEEFYPNLWAHLDLIPTIEPRLAQEVLQYLLSTCRNSYVLNILMGRRAIQALPRAWLLANIESAAEFLYEYNDDWEYRRLGELYLELDLDLLRRHVERGFAMNNPEIQEAAHDFKEMLAKRL